MTGITLSNEQIRNAPAAVRQWIEQEVIASLGLSPRAPATIPPQAAHLVACSVEDVAGVLEHIRGVLPAVNVLLELGRPGISIGQPAVMTFRLMDILHHARLPDIGVVRTGSDVEVGFDAAPGARLCRVHEHGRDQGDVGKVRPSVERIVQHDDVSAARRTSIDRSAHGHRHGA